MSRRCPRCEYERCICLNWPVETEKQVIDFTKPVQTRDGRKVTILTHTRRCANKPLLCLVHEIDGTDSVAHYKEDGNFGSYLGCGDNWKLDLINVPEEEIVVYVHAFGDAKSPIFSVSRPGDPMVGSPHKKKVVFKESEVWGSKQAEEHAVWVSALQTEMGVCAIVSVNGPTSPKCKKIIFKDSELEGEKRGDE